MNTIGFVKKGGEKITIFQVEKQNILHILKISKTIEQ